MTILLCAVVARAYRAEYLFGFVVGMTFVFDAVLPRIVFVVIATLSAVAHLMLWPALLVGRRQSARAPAQGLILRPHAGLYG
ncbi:MULTISPECIES: hypothetical protein [Xanthomonas]|uniref:hypothetical protein n=1 Tax=Xanthomonas TaxID=338 RepID=UPI00128FF8FC|nr:MULTISPECIES: hypothetical protein [Xanthomonas]